VVDAGDAMAVDGLEARVATMYPMVETALQVCLDAAPRLGEVVVVVGLGAVGILAAALLARTGAVVVGAEPEPARRSAAGRFGVRALAPDAVAGRWPSQTGGRGADLVVEASGNPERLASSLGLLAHEGDRAGLLLVRHQAGPAAPGRAPSTGRRLAIRGTQVSTIPAALGRPLGPGPPRRAGLAAAAGAAGGRPVHPRVPVRGGRRGLRQHRPQAGRPDPRRPGLPGGTA
jgi:threonine dehydrogenase-like Zn-dependent dehydrogenase